MRTNSILTAIALTTGLLGSAALAQTPLPAPTAPPAPAASPVGPMPAPNSVIYIPRLPTPAELTSAAAAQGLTIEKMEQTNAQITVVYKFANGQTNTVAYALLPAASAAPATVAAPSSVVMAPAPTVIYTSPAPAYYYDPYYSSWPWLWPVGIDIGLGYTFHRGGWGYGYHHFDGGWRGGHGWRH